MGVVIEVHFILNLTATVCIAVNCFIARIPSVSLHPQEGSGSGATAEVVEKHLEDVPVLLSGSP